MRTCASCQQVLLDSDFHPSNNRKNACCKKCKNAQVAARYKRLADEGKCFDCRSMALPGHRFCSSCKAKRLVRYHTVDHDKQLSSSRARRRQLKVEVFEAYGGALCVCCGEDKLEFLSLDHINGGGSAHRRQPGSDSGVKLYEWCKRNGFPSGFRVLCMNCNFSLGHFGYCPHGLEVQSRVG